MPSYILDLIQEAAFLQRDIEKVIEETRDEKTRVWLQMAIDNTDQTLAYLIHAQKQLEDADIAQKQLEDVGPEK